MKRLTSALALTTALARVADGGAGEGVDLLVDLNGLLAAQGQGHQRHDQAAHRLPRDLPQGVGGRVDPGGARVHRSPRLLLRQELL